MYCKLLLVFSAVALLLPARAAADGSSTSEVSVQELLQSAQKATLLDLQIYETGSVITISNAATFFDEANSTADAQLIQLIITTKQGLVDSRKVAPLELPSIPATIGAYADSGAELTFSTNDIKFAEGPFVPATASANATSEVVGYCSNGQHTFASDWTQSTPGGNFTAHALALPPNSVDSTALDINSSGDIVGQVITNTLFHSYFWHNGSPTDLGDLTGGNFGSSLANAINDSGAVVGWSANASFYTRPFIWTSGGGMTDLGALPGDNQGKAQDINDAGMIVGFSFGDDSVHHAFFYNGTFTALGALGGNASTAFAVNATGAVVGEAQIANGTYHAFFWTASGGMQDLNTLASNSTYVFTAATSIDGRGDIAATAVKNGSATPYVAVLVAGVINGNTTPGAPAITLQPANSTVNLGKAANFTVTATGTAPLKYQWSFNGKKISGATKATYSLSKTTAASAGNYTVTVSNASGNITSNPAVLTILTKPVIATQPKAASVKKGTTVKFTVKATGSPTLSYQWQLNSKNLANTGNVSGVTTTTLTITAATTANQGTYRVLVSNPAGSITSAAVKLTVK